MFKLSVCIALIALVCSASGKPAVLAPVVAAAAPAGVVTATSSQYVARNYNGIATAPVIAPVAAAAYTAPVAAAYTAPVAAAYTTSVAAPVAAAYTAPVAAAYTAPIAAAYTAPIAASYYPHTAAYTTVF
ncbi:vitelline membrane protein Vm26Ab [Glossina fuscipes]|nr:vitelline membrane protein Vm26Ab [Glossina fuscipes]